MGKFLFTTLPSNDLGLLARSLPIAQEMRNRGHEIAFCSPGKAPQKLIAEAEFDNFLPQEPTYYYIAGDTSLRGLYRLARSQHLRRDIGILMRFLRQMLRSSTAEIWNLDHFMYLFGMWNEAFVRANVDTLRAMIKEYEPHALVDFWNPFACIAARATRTPLITVIQADMHPLSRGFVWWKEPPSHLPTPVPAINTVLAECGLGKITRTGQLLTGDKTLVLGMPETDPLPASADVTYVGPIVWQRSAEDLPDWVTELDSERQLIWVYPGNLRYMSGASTAFDSAVILSACIEALKDEPVQVLLTTGHHILPNAFRPLPANFRYEPYVPGLAMARRSTLLIHHGGYGSCQTGLLAGTPALIVPTYSERESNARRIAALGAGDFVLPTTDCTGRKKQVAAEEVRNKVRDILANPSFAENARDAGRKIRGYGGARAAARLIEDFVIPQTPRQPQKDPLPYA